MGTDTPDPTAENINGSCRIPHISAMSPPISLGPVTNGLAVLLQENYHGLGAAAFGSSAHHRLRLAAETKMGADRCGPHLDWRSDAVPVEPAFRLDRTAAGLRR